MKKYTNFLSFILSFISLLGFFSITDMNINVIFINSILSIMIFCLFFYIIKKVFNNELYKNKRSLFISIFLSLLLAFTFVIGYNLTKFDLSYLDRLITYCQIISCMPIIMALIILLLTKYDKLVKNYSNFSIKKVNDFLFKNQKYTFVKCLILIIIAWIPVFLAFYPGIFSYDSSVQLNEIINHSLSNNNPFLHTLIVGNIVKLGNTLFNSYAIGVMMYTILQMLLLSCTFAYVIHYLNKKNAPFILKFIFIIIFMFLPTHSILAITTTKDVFFASTITFMMIKFIDMIADSERFFKSIFNIIITIMLIFLMFVFRHNGYYAFLVFAIFALIGLRKYWKQLLIIIICSIGLYKGYLLIVNKIINKQTTESFPNAVLCVPIQQIGRVYNLSDDLNEEELKLYKKLETEKDGFKFYESHKSDSLAWRINTDIVYNNLDEYKKFYINLGIKHPIMYIDAFLANTMGYWYIGDKLPDTGTYRTYIEIRSVDDFHNTNDQIHFDSKLPWLYDLYYNLGENAQFQQIPILSLIMGVAFNILLLFVSIAIIIYQKNYKNLIPITFLLGLLVTIFIGPVAILRYMYPVFTTMPLIIYLTINKKASNN